MNNRYHLRVGKSVLEVVDTKLFRAESPNGIVVLVTIINPKWMESNKKRLIEEYQIAPQNVFEK